MAFSILLLVALAAHLTAAQDYGSAFIGCVPAADQPSGAVNQGESGQTSDGCQFYCSINNKAYSFWTSSYSGAGKYSTQGAPACVCSDTEPSTGAITSTISADEDTVCVTATDYQVFKAYTTEQFQGCTSPNAYLHSTTGYTSYEQCLSACASSAYTFVKPLETSWQCFCGSSMGSPALTECGLNKYLIYYHDPIAQASQLTRRKLRERLNESTRQAADCPSGLTACLVEGYTDSYECIDTNAEIESCGGCINGVFGSTNATAGTDCTALAGVALGAATCTAGRCESFACESGFSLVDGACVAV
ncbi:hypothetical protein I317_00637 [Kwoniella heveanensis CBS 569]|nr:hypothetical protein I317_00637 [Kwoniella heveanensis CBS 569]